MGALRIQTQDATLIGFNWYTGVGWIGVKGSESRWVGSESPLVGSGRYR